MPVKSGASHALAAFTTIILGAVISNFLNAHSSVLRDLSSTVGGFVTTVGGVDLSNTLVGLLVISTFLSFLWGVAYHIARHQS